MDKARNKTDKILAGLERRVNAVYATDPSLLRIQKKYDKYMKRVKKLTSKSYKLYKNATDLDKKAIYKAQYQDELRMYTTGNMQYRKIIAEFIEIMAEVNQKALDLVNAEIVNIYTLNYNQLAEICEEVGIKVNG